MKLQFFSRYKSGCRFLCQRADEPIPVPCSNDIPRSDERTNAYGIEPRPDTSPEDRRARVAQLRQQVHEGTYEIPFTQLVRILAALIRGKR